MNNSRADEIHALNAEIDQLHTYIQQLEQSNIYLESENKRLQQILTYHKTQYHQLKNMALALFSDLV